MKKFINILLVIFGYLLILNHSGAQPILNASGMNPTIGEYYSYIINTNATPPYYPGNVGADQIWDLTSISGNQFSLAVQSSPYTVYADTFPGSNISLYTSSSKASYYNTSNDNYQFYGYVSGTTIYSYLNPEDVLRFPFYYNDSYSDNWSTHYIEGILTFYRTGVTTVTFDGYGTLSTPEGTYSDVARIHCVQEYQDSTMLGYLPYIVKYSNDQYKWYKDGFHFPLAGVSTLTSSLSGPVHQGMYSKGVIVGIDDELTNKNISILGNAACDEITIQLLNMPSLNIDVQIYNSVGQLKKTLPLSSGSGFQTSYKISVKDLSKGFYFINIITDNESITSEKFIVE